ncbi:MAG: hypothetical protein ABI140_19500 [Jatrophihabitantaceae bacterium]
MSDVAVRVAVAATLVWLGMVAAISFLEAPLKFRAPGLELRVGLAIGRIVFGALNLAEIIWAVVIAVCLIVDPQPVTITAAASIIGALLVIQLVAVRPRLNRRSDLVLASEPGQVHPRSRAHHAYIVLETLKATALIALASYLLAA